MSLDAPALPHGYVHQGFVYETDDQLVSVAVDLVRGAADAGDAALVVLPEAQIDLVRSAVGELPQVDLVRANGAYGSPAIALKHYRGTFEGYIERGAPRIRAMGAPPHPGVGEPWDWWARYEATLNHAFADLPLWGLCAYDRRTAPTKVLHDVAATHPYLTDPDGTRRENARFEHPGQFLGRCCVPQRDPVESTRPALELVDPSASDARHAIAKLCADTSLSPDERSDLVIAVSEVATNAGLHGRPPVRVRAWATDERVVVTVHDRGAGTRDPYAGLLPADRSRGGLGLWIAHQLCRHVSLRREPHGFTVRLVAGRPHLAPV